MKHSTIFFQTNNINKIKEVKYILKNYPLTIKQLKNGKYEIQAETIREIAYYSALHAAKEAKVPLIVEDTGLFINHLKGFPGPYTSYIHSTIGPSGILKLLVNVTDRRATFKTTVAFCDLTLNIKCFSGESQGVISYGDRGDQGFGFDAIFQPLSGSGKTFAEMNFEEKSKISHRSFAVKKFADWYLKNLSR